MQDVTFEPARPLHTGGMPWIPTGSGKSFRPLRFAADGWSEPMRLEPGSRRPRPQARFGGSPGRREVDVVIDPVGGATTARSWPVLRSGGTLVAIAEEPDPGSGGIGRRDDVRSVYFVDRPDGTQLRELARLIDDGQLRPVVSAVFELGELPDAFLAKRGDRPPGKVVISVREDLR